MNWVSMLMVFLTVSNLYIIIHLLLFSFIEIQNGPIPLPNDKAIKEKKRKLRETLDRLLLVYVRFNAPNSFVFIICQT